MTTTPARLTVLAGPTAVGKGTVSADVRARYPEVWLSVSATTRSPRPGEVDGVHYLLRRRRASSTAMVAARRAARVGRRARPQPVRHAAPARRGARWPPGKPALLEIDLQGARQVRESMPDAHFVFLAPPSLDELVRRLVGRGTEDAEERERRLATARVELAAAGGVRPGDRERRRAPGDRRARPLDGHPDQVGWPASPQPPLTLGRSPCPEPSPPPRASPTRPSTTCSKRADSKYALVIFAAKRARQINAYYSQLNEGLFEYVGPLVDTRPQEKPLSVAMREIDAGLLTSERHRGLTARAP